MNLSWMVYDTIPSMLLKYNMFLFLLIIFIGLSFDRLNIFKYCILSCLIHEAGHIAAYRFFLKDWPEIDAGIFGLRMHNNVSLNCYRNKIVFAGPFMNLLSAACGAFFLYFSFSLGCYIYTVINCFIFIFNMLPVYYLDGGQILYSKSSFYQRNYNKISIIALFLFCVMLYTFTENPIGFALPVIYYITNISNDI